MPVNFQQIYARVKEIAEGANESKRILEERRNTARDLLAAYAGDLDYLRQKVEAAKAVDANIRCATPLKESLASFYPPPVSVQMLPSSLQMVLRSTRTAMQPSNSV
jgi:hypothetical protein